MKWFLRNRHEARTDDEWTALQQSIERARQDWQYAQQHVSMSEEKETIDNAIYHLQLTQKRYVFLLDCARRYRQLRGTT
ncbi:DUF2508 family protein [Brevibacillus marinus]|uniref:DUF2508 family protein n=1 Tax=Brevibacillus marinus TaxID=2496837 RepID=UPI0013DEF502|nr:DUF2508 family protein [Brevibacillus marinus]